MSVLPEWWQVQVPDGRVVARSVAVGDRPEETGGVEIDLTIRP